MATLDPKVQETLKAGLALVFDGLSEIPGDQVAEVISDLKADIDAYVPGDKATFEKWLLDASAALGVVAADTGNVAFEKAAAWEEQIAELIAGGKSPSLSIFLSLFKKHVAPATIDPNAPAV